MTRSARTRSRTCGPRRRARKPAGPAVHGACLVILTAGLVASPTPAQETSFEALRDSALEAMGGGDVERIELTGSGWDACLGQAWSVQEGWARWELRDYRRTIDYDAGRSVRSAMRRPGLDPERLGGCGAQPDAAARSRETSIGPDSAWPEQLPIWMTPHGFLKLAERAETSVAAADPGRTVTLQLSRSGTEYTLRGHYGEDDLLERIVTWVEHPIFGRMEVETVFRDYRRFDGLRFPSAMTRKQGGFAMLDVTIDDVVVDPPPGRAVASDEPRRPGSGGAPEPAYVEIDDGVFVLRGAYQSVAVEFDDFSVVIDGMQSESRTREIIELTHEAIPDKDIRYVVNTHSHFDHATGLRQFAAAGATIVTHSTNVTFFETALSTPRTADPDVSAPTDAYDVRVRGVDGRFEIRGDAGRVLEVHELRSGRHANDMLIAYLPRSGTIVEADLLQPWINPVFGGDDGPHPYLVYLFEELERLGLDYRQFVPVHEPAEPPTMPRAALVEAVSP